MCGVSDPYAGWPQRWTFGDREIASPLVMCVGIADAGESRKLERLVVMVRTRVPLLVGAAGLVFLPFFSMLRAQGPMMFEAYAARKDLTSNPVLGGVGFVGYSGVFGLRLSGGLNVNNRRIEGRDVTLKYTQCDGVTCQDAFTTTRSPAQSQLHVGGWSADADVLVEPLRSVPVAKSLLLGFSPYAFFGIGGYGTRPINARDTSFTTLSYGIGAHHNLLGWLGLDAAARYRRPLGSDSALTIGSPRSWEYRLGLTASFGRPSSWRRPERPVTARPAFEESRPRRTIVTYSEGDVSPSRLASRVLTTAEDFVGTRYRAGGTAPGTGFDAAGFVQYVFRREGIALPHSARRMARLGERVSTRVGDLRPGDLLFFANDRYEINHVAIYVGRDRFVHATSTGSGVRYDVLDLGERGRWFADHLVTARRIQTGLQDWYEFDDDDAPDRAPRATLWRSGSR